MPTYEYRCGECGHEFEEFHSITADPLDTCPECSGTVQRLISAGNGLIFKGSGFYITDYKNTSDRSANKGEGKGEAKSESKPEKKESKENKTTKKSTES